VIDHVGLGVSDLEQSKAFYRQALHPLGYQLLIERNGPPGLRPHYHQHYYGAFVLDPDGNNIEAVCHRPSWRCGLSDHRPPGCSAGHSVLDRNEQTMGRRLVHSCAPCWSRVAAGQPCTPGGREPAADQEERGSSVGLPFAISSQMSA